MQQNLSIIFPAFVSEYLGTELAALSIFDNNFAQKLSIASQQLNIDLTGFDFRTNNFLHDEIRSQYISYIFSCSVADVLNSKNIIPSCIAGYSMGIYASLYYSGSLSFDGGLWLVKSAWEKICSVTKDGIFGMGMIVGLNESEIMTMISDGGAEICNRNNPHTFIISGIRAAVEKVLEGAKTEGALRANMLPVSKPYHSSYINNAASEFSTIVRSTEFKAPNFRYVSAIDQKIIGTAEGLKNEVIRNINFRMNWHDTMKTIIVMGVKSIFECGVGEGLTRNSRFIEGDLKSFSINKLDKFIEAASD